MISRRSLAVDTALATALTGFTVTVYLLTAGKTPTPPLTTADILGGALAFLAVAARRRAPRAVLVAVTAGLVGHYTAVEHGHPLLVLAAAIVAYTVASTTDRRTTLMLAVGCGLAIYLGNALVQAAPLALESLPTLTFIGMAAAFGDATRSRRAYLAEVEERARRAEQTREEEAQRRVIQERLRIARELHDVVAHHIAVINVQAAAASHLLDRRPEQVRPALDQIRVAGDDVLKELGSIVGVLRQSDDPVSTEPIPGLERLPALLETIATAGLRVAFSPSGAERELPAMADLAAYRIVQEALTNAHKYGDGTADLRLTYTERGLRIEVTNRIGEHRQAGSGYGIVGMRERAAAADGTLDVYETPDGRFVVDALISGEKS